jgi:rod shape determining protein RodA
MSLKKRTQSYDYLTLSLLLALLVLGWLMIYASEYTIDEAYSPFSLATNAGKQLLWVGLSAFVFFLVQIMDARFWRTFAYPLYFLGLLLLVLVLIFGSEIKGATSWFTFGGFSFQPSEYMKFATALALAAYLSYFKTNLNEASSRWVAIGIFSLPVLLILLQPDAGSALVFLSFFLVLFREGLNPLWYLLVAVLAALVIFSLIFESNVVITFLGISGIALLTFAIRNRLPWIFSGLLVAVITVILMIESFYLYGFLLMGLYLLLLSVILLRDRKEQWPSILWPAMIVMSLISFGTDFAFNHFLEAHQQDRINVWLKPEECDPRGSLYNVLQSKMAIGSGGFSGKGYLKGTMTQFNYVPEQSTDFIFCTIGEEWGFLGSTLIILLFFGLILRITIIAERARAPFDRHYAYALAGILFVHVMINLGMTMGLVPIIGIPLPFISYGGSSLLIFSLMMAVLLKMDRERSA